MKILLISVVAWVAGLLSILTTSYFFYESPGIQDTMGFGGILLAGSLLLILLFYIPALRILKRRPMRELTLLLFSLIPAFILNIPVYLVLLFQSGIIFGSGEGFLFGIGFFTMAFVFGTSYAWSLAQEQIAGSKLFVLKKKKIFLTLTITALMCTILFYFFEKSRFRQSEFVGMVNEITSMHTKRSAHTATRLDNGMVLVCGGIFEAAGTEVNNASAELFNPEEEMFVKTGNMHSKRAGHTATLLHNGNVLVTGGFDSSGFLNTAEIYHIGSGTFESINSHMSEKRAGHTATLLKTGQVLVAGGVSGSANSNIHFDIYDPETGSFNKTGSLNVARTGHTATLLADGRVLFCGGSQNWRSDVLRSCEMYDPLSNSFFFTDSLKIARNKQVAVLLNDGSVLIAGGSAYADRIGGRYNSTEIFDPKTQTFRLLESKMNESRFKITNAADLLENGDVVIAGDGKYVDVFDGESQRFLVPRGNLEKSWMYPTVTTLQNGKVLITGGYDNRMRTTAGTWLFETGINQTGISQAVKY